MFAIEACFTNPRSAGTFWTVSNDFFKISLVLRILFVFNALNTEAFDTGPFNHYQWMSIFCYFENVFGFYKIGFLICRIDFFHFHVQFRFWLGLDVFVPFYNKRWVRFRTQFPYGNYTKKKKNYYWNGVWYLWDNIYEITTSYSTHHNSKSRNEIHVCLLIRKWKIFIYYLFFEVSNISFQMMALTSFCFRASWLWISFFSSSFFPKVLILAEHLALRACAQRHSILFCLIDERTNE